MNDYDIELPAEFRSGNDIPVTQATIRRERMEEILREVIEAAEPVKVDTKVSVPSDPAVAAIQFALQTDEALQFLQCWNEGNFDAICREWPEAPEEVFIGADPMHPETRALLATYGQPAQPTTCKFSLQSADCKPVSRLDALLRQFLTGDGYIAADDIPVICEVWAQPAVSVEGLARKFHETYERLAPKFGYETRQETREFDPNTPNGKLMLAVCAAISAPVAAQPSDAEDDIVDLLAEYADHNAEHGRMSFDKWTLRDAVSALLAKYGK